MKKTSKNIKSIEYGVIYEDQAVSHMMQYLTQMPDTDSVLQRAGISRSSLKELMYDDEIAQACETRLDALLAVPVRLEPSEGDSADFLRKILTPVLRDCTTAALQARLFGYSVIEATYKSSPDGKIILDCIGEKPMEWFEPKSDGRLIYRADNGSGSSHGVQVDTKYKFFLTRCRATYANPYGEALISRLYWPWFFRQNGRKFWAKFLERFGSPILVGKSENPKEMVAALLSAHNQAVVGVGRDDSVDVVGAGTGNNGSAFESFDNANLRQIQKIILGQTLTSGTDGGSGNRALGQVHDNVRLDKRTSDINLIKDTIQRIVNALCDLNGLSPHNVIFADETGLEVERATRDKDLAIIGVAFNKSYFEDAYDLKPTDFEINTSRVTQSKNTSFNKSTQSSQFANKKTAENFSIPSNKFTLEQQDLEVIANAMSNQAFQPISIEIIRNIVFSANSAEDVENKLIQAVSNTMPYSQFSDLLEQALFAADVIGYSHSENGL